MIRRTWHTLGTLCLISLLFGTCAEDKRPLPDVSDIETPLNVRRFEQSVFNMDTMADFSTQLAQLRTEYPEFLDLFSANVLEVGPLEDPSPEQVAYWRGFVGFPALRQLYDTVQIVYGDFSEPLDDIRQGLRYFAHYFPDQPLPQQLTTFISEYTYAAFLYGENELAVGLDMFLGADYPYAQYNPNNPFFSQYLTRTYNKDHLPAKVMSLLIDDVLGPAPGNRLLDIMVHNGKRLYLLDQLLPEAPDTVKLEVAPAQLTWLQDNELNMWSYFLAEDLLYSSQYQDIRKLVEPSPSGAPVLPEDSPGQAANYIGWQIINAFMDRRADLPVSELLLYQDAQQILDQSRYKPPKQ